MVSPIPSGHNVASPYLVVTDSSGLIEFLKRTFGAEEVGRLGPPGGPVHHAEVRIGDSIVMMGDRPDSPMPGQVHCYVADVDAVYARALAAGATSMREPIDMFYGDRISMVKDPFGNIWAISTHKEDVSHEEMGRRMAGQAKG
jgi:PhnB protein